MPLSKNIYTSITTLALCTAMLPVKGQIPDSIPAKKPIGYIASYWHNGIALLASPTKWKGDEWAKFGGTIAISTVILSMDEPISQPFFNWQTKVGTGFGNAGKVIGSVPFQLGLSGLALGTGAIAHNKPLINFALDNLQAQAFTGGITWLVKELSHRARPELGLGAYEWLGPFKTGDDGYASFFSGHASVSYCTATMIYLHSHKKWWVGLIGFTAATGVAISRMQTQSHWASDVVIGSVVGSAVATFVYKQQEKRRHPSQKQLIIP
jgi:membrane-associated phospholipid phosphatase